MSALPTSALALGAAAAATGACLACAAGGASQPEASTEDIANVFDLGPFLRETSGPPSEATLATCRAMSEYLAATGVLVVRDPRVSSSDNDTFLGLMQRYYSQPVEALMEDARPDIFYQVGVTPELVETAVCSHDTTCKEVIAKMDPDNRPLQPHGADPKWRFFWRIGERPEASATKFEELNAPPVVPKAFGPEWKETMDAWGKKVLGATVTVAEMIAVGFGEPRDTFTSRMHLGPHLLAPTGSDLNRYAKVNTIFAGWHQDLNFLTIHGKSNYPGLSVWTKEGKKMAVKVPQGCLLLQAGMQIEYLTAGKVQAGYHEVVLTSAAQAAAQKAKAAGKNLWRISSTMFTTLNHDTVLEPLGQWKNEPGARDSFPPLLAGDQVANQLKKIGMAQAANSNNKL